MFKIVVTFIIPLLITVYFVIDVIIPSFTEKQYWWFLKSFFGKSKESSFEIKIKEAEDVYKDAKKKMSELKQTANEEKDGAKERLSKAEKTYDNAKKTLEKLKK